MNQFISKGNNDSNKEMIKELGILCDFVSLTISLFTPVTALLDKKLKKIVKQPFLAICTLNLTLRLIDIVTRSFFVFEALMNNGVAGVLQIILIYIIFGFGVLTFLILLRSEKTNEKTMDLCCVVFFILSFPLRNFINYEWIVPSVILATFLLVFVADLVLKRFSYYKKLLFTFCKFFGVVINVAVLFLIDKTKRYSLIDIYPKSLVIQTFSYAVTSLMVFLYLNDYVGMLFDCNVLFDGSNSE